MDPFATAGDVAARWRALSAAETALADQLCADASDMIRTRWTDVDARIATGSLTADSVKRVVANMVKRAMIVGDTEGIESRSQAAGPFSISDKFTNPNGNLFFSEDDRRLFEPERFNRTARVGWLA